MSKQPNVQELQGPFLPRSTVRLVDPKEGPFSIAARNPGLQLDKFSELQLDRRGMMEEQKAALNKVCDVRGNNRLLADLNRRRSAMLDQVAAHRLTMYTAGPLTLHLSRAGIWENAGICLHPVYGFVYLPGSGLKGLARSWAETVWAPAQDDAEQAWRTIEEIFGISTQSEAHKFSGRRGKRLGWRPDSIPSQEGSSVGRIVFHEAWPQRWPQLTVDVANNHHMKYYGGDGAPGDWENPNLVYFLAVPVQTRFEFFVSDRLWRDGVDGVLKLAAGWLRDALMALGAGAKTSAGYGRFVVEERGTMQVADLVDSREFELELVTPAFLAGADQAKGDCTLRGATLRGLLRWWWRTMYAGKVDEDTLRVLEAAVWGSAQEGSPLGVAARRLAGGMPAKFSKAPHHLRAAGIVKGKGKRSTATLGLFYASYGMAERTGVRWYSPEGSRWQVMLTAREGWLERSEEEAITLGRSALMDQATAALWLLTRYGGAGSKGRNGFGSFKDIAVEGVESIEDCHKRASEFLELCRKRVNSEGKGESPALEHALILPEVSTAWGLPWHACHQVGTVMQSATRALAKEKRKGLGLPRRGAGRIGSGLDRHASPVHWSVTQQKDGALAVRMIAFPSSKLPNFSTSRQILVEFQRAAQTALDRYRNRRPARGARKLAASRQRSNPGALHPETKIPKPGERVEVELLREKTRKGRWKVKDLASGLIGPVQDDAQEVVTAGQIHSLFVHSVNEEKQEIQFRWKSQSKKKRGPTRKPSRRRGRGRGKRGRQW